MTKPVEGALAALIGLIFVPLILLYKIFGPVIGWISDWRYNRRKH